MKINEVVLLHLQLHDGEHVRLAFPHISSLYARTLNKFMLETSEVVIQTGCHVVQAKSYGDAPEC